MDLEWKYSEEELDWNELSELYRIAPLGEKKPDILKKAFGASMFKCFVYGDGKLVAVGRALADGVDCSYLCDVAVHPEVQGSGLGRAVVDRRRGAFLGLWRLLAPGRLFDLVVGFVLWRGCNAGALATDRQPPTFAGFGAAAR